MPHQSDTFVITNVVPQISQLNQRLWRFLESSVHQLAEAVEHAPAVDYLIAGTVFPTVSKPADSRLLGEGGLSRMAAAVDVPILAFGPHKDVEGFRSAKAAGVTRVVANGEFSRSLPDLVRRYATPVE